MSDDLEIADLMNTMNVDPKVDDHEPKVAEEEPDVAAVTNLAEKFAASLTDMSANQQRIFDSLLGQMEKNNAPAEVAPAPAQVAPVYVPNPALEPMKTFDPDSYAVLIEKDKMDFDRDQQMMSILNKQANQIDGLVEANNNNLGYLEESVVGAKHSDASVMIKSPEFISWIDDQNFIVKGAYNDVLEKGSPAERIKLIDMFKEQATVDKDAAALAAVAKGTEVEKTKLPAPGSLTDFESSRSDNSNVGLLELAMDPDKIEKYLATANGDPEQIAKLTDNLTEALAREM